MTCVFGLKESELETGGKRKAEDEKRVREILRL